MRSTFVWLALATSMILLSLGNTVNAWNRQIFNRYSRNLLRKNELGAALGGNNELNEFGTLFGLGRGNDATATATRVMGPNLGGVGIGMPFGDGGGGVAASDGFNFDGIGLAQQPHGQQQLQQQQQQQQQQQTEVYGIVEPLIEDMPCMDRPCNVNDDCCLTGVCVNTYGEGKCVYVYGRKRDLCHRNQDCEPGMSCLKSAIGNFVCQPTNSALRLLNGPTLTNNVNNNNNNIVGTMNTANAYEFKQFGEDCLTSSDCNVAKGMCCQLQRSHHRMLPKKMCAYFRDPFMCIDIMAGENEDARDSHYFSSFSQRRM